MVSELIKAASSAHTYRVTVGLYGAAFIAIRPKMAEMYMKVKYMHITDVQTALTLRQKHACSAETTKSIFHIIPMPNLKSTS